MSILIIKDENGNITDVPAIRGRSAYEIWRAAGNEGSVTDFLASLNGVRNNVTKQIQYKYKEGSETKYVSSLPYLFYQPDDTIEELPLIVILHSAYLKSIDGFSVGDNLDNLAYSIAYDDFCNALVRGVYGKIPAYIVMPQTSSSSNGWAKRGEEIVNLVTGLTQKFNIDANKISVMGFSIGGIGAFELAYRYPETFKRVLSAAGGLDGISKNVTPYDPTTGQEEPSDDYSGRPTKAAAVYYDNQIKVMAVTGTKDDEVELTCAKTICKELGAKGHTAVTYIETDYAHNGVRDACLGLRDKSPITKDMVVDFLLGREGYYYVSNILTNCTNGNVATTVAYGGSYSATLTSEDGSAPGSVTVMMNGTDVTNDVYDKGLINIETVNGNVVIIAGAESEEEEEEEEEEDPSCLLNINFTEKTVEDYVSEGLLSIPDGSDTTLLSYGDNGLVCADEALPYGLKLSTPIAVPENFTAEFTLLYKPYSDSGSSVGVTQYQNFAVISGTDNDSNPHTCGSSCISPALVCYSTSSSEAASVNLQNRYGANESYATDRIANLILLDGNEHTYTLTKSGSTVTGYRDGEYIGTGNGMTLPTDLGSWQYILGVHQGYTSESQATETGICIKSLKITDDGTGDADG